MKCLHRKSFLKRRLNLVPGSERSGPWEGCGKQPPTTDARPDVPDDPQMAISADTANIYHHYAPRGQFRPGHC